MNPINLSQKVWQDPIYFIGFGFGSGLMPIAPGTWGSLAAVPLYLLLAGHSLGIYLLCTLAAFALGVWVCDKISQDLGEHDYSGIVWDEVVGYLLTMTMVPVGLVWMILGFLLFRLFDVWKPQPIRFIDERIKGGLGIMLDDLLAAVPAWLILQLLVWGFAK
ncbi:phosphatidylglycerophosphatase A family protein [Legionella micdadei]|uniref:Phosphatidylglycerophosphatase A n=1 Tax=Legionella micdadei TaxID=451 RepID=A0A098GI86_LEGMI|nr:phosphatidylglycerophosphatase A [Legionella micdadei]ARG96898.1 phosphatidylglycerophosphatase A [Legionella micdadei]ARG99631.1 phosphatidylglycerophosphatase A [Legionella micdadei]KTD26582.1 phosphatidylglycerophosphatase A [Legionella micdadei]NSL17827.1 phosphatidylglycerophosphatase A [Legionella micdadei]CEG61700.1 Phosphatidylglycerophosphatase A [Legionella micdadei]